MLHGKEVGCRGKISRDNAIEDELGRSFSSIFTLRVSQPWFFLAGVKFLSQNRQNMSIFASFSLFRRNFDESRVRFWFYGCGWCHIKTDKNAVICWFTHASVRGFRSVRVRTLVSILCLHSENGRFCIFVAIAIEMVLKPSAQVVYIVLAWATEDFPNLASVSAHIGVGQTVQLSSYWDHRQVRRSTKMFRTESHYNSVPFSRNLSLILITNPGLQSVWEEFTFTGKNLNKRWILTRFSFF